MSRIRSQLDTILAGNGTVQNNASAPKPAFSRTEPQYAPQPQTAPQEPRQQYTAPPAQPAPNRDLQTLQNSLEKLSQRINAIPRQPAPVQDNTAQLLQSSQASLVNEIKNGYHQISQELANQQGIANKHLESDLKRIADGIAMLQNTSSVHPDYVEQMQSELTNLNVGLNQLISTPPSQVDLSGVSRSIETGYSDIVNKLDQVLSNRGSEMPEISVPDYSQQFVSLNERLEEVTRAVVSLTVTPNNQDTHAFERIEARLASLSKAVDDIAAQSEAAPAQFSDPLNSELGDTIAAQIAQLSEKMDNIGVMGDVGANIFADVQGIAGRLDTLQNEFGILAANLDRAAGENGQVSAVPAPSVDLTEIENQLAGLANKMDELFERPNDNPNTSSQEVLEVLRDLVGRVENIEAIAQQEVAEGPYENPNAHLEEQLAAISAQLGSLDMAGQGTGVSTVDLTPITERLDHIEGQIATSRDIVLDIASEAAQKAAAAVGGEGQHDGAAFASVLDELRQLREAQSQAPAHEYDNPQLGEISSTINAIASQLAEMESQNAAQFAALSSVETHTQAEQVQAPSHAYDTTYEPPVVASSFNRRQAAAVGTADEFATNEMPASDYSDPMPSTEYAEHMAHVEEAPSLDMAQMDTPDMEPVMQGPADEASVQPEAPEGEDVPLAPGTAIPDLEALVRNATKRKKDAAAQNEAMEEDGSTSELLAAARRAARVASQEASEINEKPTKKAAGKSALSNLKAPSFVNKKMLMMSAAVAVIAIGGFTLAPKFFGSQPVKKVSAVQPAAPAQNDTMAATDDKIGETQEAQDGVRVIDETASADKGSALLSSEPVAENAPKAFSETNNDTMAASLDQSATVDNSVEAAPAKMDISDIPADIGNAALVSAMAAGDGSALFEAARRYTDGDGVERNLENAVIWYRKAAEAGNVPAQYRLGNFYEKGHGVTADQKEAAKWYTKAAASGNALAIHNLAVLNAMGVIDGEPDMTTAVGWFEKAADMGVKDSQVNLGILYTKGMGVEEDLERAYKWFAVAAKGGDNDAVKKRDTVAQAMRPEQLEKARGEAELWKPVKLDPSANIAEVKPEWKSDAPKKVKQLTKAELVKETQILLTKAGFDAGVADGQFGKRTQKAIMDFQQKMGMTVDGKITKGLIEALLKAEA